jgi:GntR family transcriptional regulator, transcriptional repressor for pyruvate dehydrogenase complex
VSRKTAVMSVVESLKTMIPLRYKPGELLQNERLIAEEYDVSRNTVREALIYLEAYGIIEKTQRGPLVCAPDISDVFQVLDRYFDRSFQTCSDLIAFRRMIDVGALPQVIRRITEADIDRLQDHFTTMGQALTGRESAQADYAFHKDIMVISGNSILIKLYTVLAGTLVFYLEIGKSNNTHDQGMLATHQRIIEALSARSEAAAVTALDEHYAYAERNLVASYPHPR